MKQGGENRPEELGSALTEFSGKVCRYFLEFLETDFKRHQAPRRRIQLKTDSGFRCGIPLRKYPKLSEKIWTLAAKPVSEDTRLKLARKVFTSPISSTLRNLIAQHVESIDPDAFASVRRETAAYAQRQRARGVDHPEKYGEEVGLAFVELVGTHIIRPILALLDGPFREQSYSALESVFEIETDLIDGIVSSVLAQLPTAINTFVVKSDLTALNQVLEEFFTEREIRERIIAFFEDFSTADAFHEFRDLLNYARTADNLQLYLYICELRFGTTAYPLFYIPATSKFVEDRGEYEVDFDPHLFVNKRAVDFVLQELRGDTARIRISPLDDRISYLSEERSLLDEMEVILKKLTPAIDVAGDLDIRSPRPQFLASSQIKLSNVAYFSVFDKSDEALLNDYEALLAAVNADQAAVNEVFGNIISGLVIGEPKSVRQEVDKQWDEMPIHHKLVAASPIPLNEEQRKILSALRNRDCHYLAVQGPPGTGKSHTITAIAFDCILNGQSILVLSDKQEALDVVQDKLEETLSKVRHRDDFPNPILRLGRIGGSYGRLLSQTAQEHIRQQYRAHATHRPEREAETTIHHSKLESAIQQTVANLGAVKLTEIEELHRLEVDVERQISGYSSHLQETRQSSDLLRLAKQAADIKSTEAQEAVGWISGRFTQETLEELLTGIQVGVATSSLLEFRKRPGALLLFSGLAPRHEQLLSFFVSEYEALRRPLVGYLFSGKKVRELNAHVGDSLPCPNPLDLHHRIDDLRYLLDVLANIREISSHMGLEESHGEQIYNLLSSKQPVPPGLHLLKSFLEEYLKTVGLKKESLASLSVGGTFATASELFTFLLISARYAELWSKLKSSIGAVPIFDYLSDKTKLERLYTSTLAHEIDRRFIEFVDTKKATARALGGVIKNKQQFPQDSFESLKEAFPCIIAGIREFAEYVPLKHKIFDVVIIDEASQVSVAQAFPALLRAKKVVVFGDQKQFSNVKSGQASNILNAGYLTELEGFFRGRISNSADKIQRLKQFDVKKSILEFFELIASYHTMLRKHFRGYQELISFSSKHFYDGQLQAIKIRGKSIDEVIRFSIVDHDGRTERYQNVNTFEAEFILGQLRKLLETGANLTVGVITPFREQQLRLSQVLLSSNDADRFEDSLKLKIMTFDTCQGEERDVVFYSMVATKGHDRLKYIFPVTLDNAEDQIEEKLKMQRLNVGLSRAKETIHFVLSKPIEEFTGSIGRVLTHYKNLAGERRLPEADDTDPASPMERKVLAWLERGSFYQQNEEHLEVMAQFPIGEYLRQLDPSYHQPAYRCDFLLRYFGGTRPVNVILEYDGFAEHFTQRDNIHEQNYEQYYRPEDVERQLVLQSYGYKFIRLNRFNLGSDPIQTISERLNTLIREASKDAAPPSVKKIIIDADNLADGSSKHCRKCKQVKDKQDFYDEYLSNGKGGFGQICKTCKGPRKPPGRYTHTA